MAAALEFDPSSARPADGPPAKPEFDPTSAKIVQPIKPKVDYDSGLTFADRVALGQADNLDEKKLYLNKVYGADNVVEVESQPNGSVKVLSGPNKGQRRENREISLAIKRDGKLVSAEGGGAMTGAGATMMADAPIILGAMGGAAMGGPAGAVLGGMAGKSAMEIQKLLEGRSKKTDTEAVRSQVEAASGVMAGEIGGKVIAGGVSRLLRGKIPAVLSQTTPEVDKLTEGVLAGGARPPAASTMPGMKKIQWMEALAQKSVSGVKAQDTANEHFVRARMGQVLEESGLPPTQVEATLKELGSADSRVSTAEVGDSILKAVSAHKEMLETNVKQRLAATNKDLDRQMSRLDMLTNRFNTDDLGIDVAGGIRQARSNFGTAMSKAYDRVDQMVGEAPLVPTTLIRSEAARIARKLPQTVQAPVTREMSGMGAARPAGPPPIAADVELFRSFGIELPTPQPGQSAKISFGDAQRMRTILRERSDDPALTRGVTQGEMHVLAKAVDTSIQMAGRDPAARSAVALLNQVDELYSKGIKRFDDTTVKRLVKDMAAGLPPDPETVAARIVQPGQEARVKMVRKLVGEEAWKKVAGADYANIVRSSTDPVTGAVDGVRFLTEVNSRRELMQEVYGNRNAAEIREVAKTMAVRDGSLPASMLRPGQMSQTLKDLQSDQAALDDFMKKNVLSAMANPKANPERAYSWLVRPDNGAALKKTVGLLGENSQEVALIRQTAVKDLLTNVKMQVAEGNAPDALSKAFNGYTKEQQKILFPHGLADDIHLLGDEIQFVMKKHSDESKASFAAGAVLGLPFGSSILLRIPIAAYQIILSHPATIRYLALGLRSKSGPIRRATRQSLETIIRTGGVEMERTDTNRDSTEPLDGQ